MMRLTGIDSGCIAECNGNFLDDAEATESMALKSRKLIVDRY